MRFKEQLICPDCNVLLVSDGVCNWVCPHRGELIVTYEGEVKKVKPHEGPVIHDARLSTHRSVKVCRPAGPPGLPALHQRVRTKVHKGSQRACFNCNPRGAANWRAHVARLKQIGWRVSL